MANRGERKRQKSIAAQKVRGFERKEDTFTPRSKPGPHDKWTSVPLSFALRHVLRLSANMKETKKILSGGNLLVNGRARKKPEFPVGLFDVIEIVPAKQKFRLYFDTKGRMIAKAIDHKEGGFKVSKITGKYVGKGGKMYASTSDGFTLEIGKEKINVEDSVKVSFPNMKVAEVYPMAGGSIAFIVSGKHTGKTVRLEGVHKGSLKTHTVVEFSENGDKYQTLIDNVFVVGKSKPEIEVLA